VEFERTSALPSDRLLPTAQEICSQPSSGSLDGGAIRRRSLIVLLSDFITAPGWERPLLQLTERHEVVAIRLIDPREYELPDAGVIVVEDTETGEQLTVDSSDAEFRHHLLHQETFGTNIAHIVVSQANASPRTAAADLLLGAAIEDDDDVLP